MIVAFNAYVTKQKGGRHYCVCSKSNIYMLTPMEDIAQYPFFISSARSSYSQG